MSGGPWFKCFPSDFLNGVSELGPHEIAVYTIILMRMYDEGGPVPDDPVRIARRCNMRLPACQKAIDSLCADGKLVRQDGMLINERAQDEIEQRHERNSKQARNAQARWQKEPEINNKNNKGTVPPQCQRDPDHMPTRSQKPDTRSQNKKEREGAPARRGTRLPADWTPSPENSAFCRKEGLTDDDAANIGRRFKNHWLAKPGKDAVKLDWDRTWENWVLRDIEDGRVGNRGSVQERRGAASDVTLAAEWAARNYQ